MTEAGWTREKPTEPGWYWWRQALDMMAVPKEVLWHPFYRGLTCAMGETFEQIGGQWSSAPIEPPKEA